jgi:hypothetical protein
MPLKSIPEGREESEGSFGAEMKAFELEEKNILAKTAEPKLINNDESMISLDGSIEQEIKELQIPKAVKIEDLFD